MTQQDWQDAISESPADHELKLVYSDWLEDYGRICEAQSWRWLAQTGRMPRKSLSNTKLIWDSTRMCFSREPNAALPDVIYDEIVKSHLVEHYPACEVMLCEDYWHAFELVIAALGKVGKIEIE